jgi:hypothetical protein
MKKTILILVWLIPGLIFANPLSPFTDKKPLYLEDKTIAHSGETELISRNNHTLWQIKKSGQKQLPITFSPAKNQTWDLAKKLWFCIDIHNHGLDPVLIRGEISAEWKKVLGGVLIEPQQKQTLAIFMPQSDSRPANYTNLYGSVKSLPNGSISLKWREIDSSNIDKLTLYSYSNSGQHNLEVSGFRGATDLVPLENSELAVKKRPYTDIYGQSTLSQWPEKILEKGHFAIQKQAETEDLKLHIGNKNLSRFGGLLSGPQFKASGHFYVKKHDGKWWFIDPEGYMFWSFGISGVNNSSVTEEPKLNTILKNAQDLNRQQGLKRNQWNPRLLNIEKKYGANWQESYSQILHQRFKSWGLNTFGNWSTKDYYSLQQTPYTVAVHYRCQKLSKDAKALPDVFHSSFSESLSEKLITLKEEANDPWCLGFFIDNELDFGSKSLSTGLKVLGANKATKTYIDAISQLQIKYQSIDHLNKSWNSQYTNWDQLEVNKVKSNKNLQKDLLNLGRRYLEKYFSTCAELMEIHAPNKLYLGSRIHRKENHLAIESSGKFADVISINCYDFTPLIIKSPKNLDKPIIIGEFHFGTLNERGVWGGGLCTSPNLEQAAKQFKAYLKHALLDPRFVGAHYFQLYDQALTGRKDGENYRIGFLSITDTPYPSMIKAAREIAAEMYALRRAKNLLIREAQ